MFLQLLAGAGRIRECALAAGLSTTTVYRKRKEDAEFEKRLQDALQGYKELLERETHRRGVDGWEEPVYQKGAQVGTVRRFSDRLLELALKRHCPEWREKIQLDANLSGGVIVVSAPPANLEEWQKKFENGEVKPDGEVREK